MQTDQTEPAAYGIASFCAAHGISRGFYYKLDKQGLGPRYKQVGARRIISREAAAEWRNAVRDNATVA